jgi:uncharacterized protein (TIGR03086 family)
MDIIELLGRALDQTGTIVEGVRQDQWDLPTPCTDWDVRTLVGHLVRGNENTAAVAEGRERQPHPIADVGDDPKEAFRRTAPELIRAWREHGELDRPYQTPLGMMPGRALLTLRLADNITHGWDLARATEQTPPYDDDLVQTALTFAQATLSGNRPPGGAFAPSVATPDDIPAIDRLAAFLGRQP